MCRRRPTGIVSLLGLFLTFGADAAAQPKILTNATDAYVARDEDALTWEIGNAGIRARFGFDRDGNFVLDEVSTPGGPSWVPSARGDSLVTLSGRQTTVGARGFQFEQASFTQRGSGVEIAFAFRTPDGTARIERHYACYPDAPVIELWTVVAPSRSDRPLQLSNMNALEFRVRAGTLRWITGLNTPDQDGGPFTLAWDELEDGGQLQIGSRTRATETALPWVMVDTSREQFFAGVLWPGEWQITAKRTGDALTLTAGLPDIQTTLDGPRELPHAYFGATGGSVRQAAEATRAFVAASIRMHRPMFPLVTYNTWFAYGTAVDETSMLAELDVAATLGVELFVLDAGWYRGSSNSDDFTTGLGLWEVDSERFPSGLNALRDAAHERGLKFGIWVEPERVDRTTVGRPGLALERWLAASGGRYDPGVAQPKAAQICLAGREAREWVFQQLVRFIEEVRPDYLKWDNNFWVNCDRGGHDHGTRDGNYGHVTGLLDIFSRLRERFPDLLIENCSGGGNRLEPSMLAFSDVSWMDDQTFSGQRIRHHLQGLSALLPSASLLSFVMPYDWAAGDDRADLPLSFRSRMPGALGLSWRGPELVEWQISEIQREITIYKTLRDVIVESSATVLSEQVPLTGASGWDVIQQTSSRSGDVLVFAFENRGAKERLLVRPRFLEPGASYRVVSVDRGALGTATGDELMRDGIEIVSSPVSRAHVLRLYVAVRPAR
jgi:alpha-galactosidase